MRHALATGLMTFAFAVNAHAQAAGTAKPAAVARGAAAAKAGAPAKPTRTAGGVPRTAWGDPDLQGTWDYWTFTPLEMNHDARIIPLGNRPHLPGHVKTWLGDSRGRWEGNTLVVESTNFTPKLAAFSARRGASGYEFGAAESVRLIERFRRVDAKTLEYEFTVNDPSTFTSLLPTLC